MSYCCRYVSSTAYRVEATRVWHLACAVSCCQSRFTPGVKDVSRLYVCELKEQVLSSVISSVEALLHANIRDYSSYSTSVPGRDDVLGGQSLAHGVAAKSPQRCSDQDQRGNS
jgi:hypothetical protein